MARKVLIVEDIMNQAKKPSLVKNSIVNVIRYVMKIVLPMITFPYVTRTLLPENYGKVNFCTSIFSYFLLLAGLGITEYAVREGAAFRNKKNEMGKFTSQVFTIGCISTVISYALLILFLVLGSFNKDYKIILAIQSISLITMALSVEWIYTVYEDFTFITIRSFIFQVINIVCIYTLVKSENDYFIYAAIISISTGLEFLVNFINARKYVRFGITTKPDFKLHLRPILVLFCNAALISVYLYSDKIIMGILMGDEAVGIYEVSVKIYMMVKGALNAVALTMMPRLAAYLRENKLDEYKSLANKSLNVQLIIMSPAIVGLFMVSSNAVSIFAGEEYMKATGSLQILSIALAFAVLANMYAYVLMITQRMDKKILFATIFSSLLNVILNFIFIPLFGIYAAAGSTLISEFAVAAYGIYSCRKIVPLRFNAKSILIALAGSTSIVIICIAVSYLKLPLMFDTILKVVLSAGIYLILILLFNKELISSALARLKKK